MEVIKSKRAGFCFGVKRALNMAYETLKKSKLEKGNAQVFTLGDIVHNSFVVDQLKKDGIITVYKPSDLKKGYLIIRSHGICMSEKKEAQRKKMKLTDATCPLVKRIHELVDQLQKEGYKVIIIGHKDHPEVKGIAGHAGKNYLIIENVDQVKKIKKDLKLGIVVQTTFLLENFQKIVSAILEKTKEIKVFNTICLETKLRQKMTEDISKKVDVMVVVGGKNSSNTRRLAEISKKYCKNCYQVESAKELKKEWFRGTKKAGLTAGASTPDWIINEVIKVMKNMNN
jgi:4-hydroxy-3-methylbut-2-enyl diphosphate reductase